MRKQLKKPIDIYEALTIEGIDISYSTVLRMIRNMEKNKYNPSLILAFKIAQVFGKSITDIFDYEEEEDEDDEEEGE